MASEERPPEGSERRREAPPAEADLEGVAPSVVSFYHERAALHRADLARHARRSSALSVARLVTFLLAATAAGAAIWGRSGPAGAGAGALGAAFVALVVWHARVARAEERSRAALTFCERGLARAAVRLEGLPPRGGAFNAEGHPYAGDLDLFGGASLLQLLDAMEAELSEARLARWLAEPGPLVEARARQGAVRELGPMREFREELYVLSRGAEGTGGRFDAFLAWCRGAGAAPPAWVAALALPLVAAGLFAALGAGPLGLPSYVPALVYLAGLALNQAASAREPEALSTIASGASVFGAYGTLLERVTSGTWSSPSMTALAARLRSRGADAPSGLRSLGRLAAWAEARENGLFRAFIAPFLAYDFWLVYALRRWRGTFGPHAGDWFDAAAEALALAGLGTFAFEHPAFAYPELVEGAPTFRARGLVHPLLPPRSRVANDVALEGPGHALLVTGSNMSGKSTLLRSMGVAVVLARAGAPAPAASLEVSALALQTSMRVRDSLAAGVSHFYAELLALRRVVEAAEGGAPVFFLLDEILHGTNSRERHLGAKSVIKHLLGLGALGAVSTHDTALSDLVDESGGHVRPVHLLEQTEGERMTFDYRLREGVVHAGNALRLMRALGLPVPPPPERA
ncbi:MAG TPA: DNA mismatch repair protein MutS [Polyangiaceae bacterium]|nr:DNA mismatch repair protein MutS [Polyangiaceae bacterium]